MALVHGGFDLQIVARLKQFKTELGAAQGSAQIEEIIDYINNYDHGNGQNRINAVYSAKVSALSAGDIDLRGGFTGPYGDAVAFPIVMGMFFKNLSTTPGQYVTVSAPASNAFLSWCSAASDGVRVGPQGVFALFSPLDGYATTAGTADLLTLTPSSGTPSFAYMFVGRDV